MKALAVASIVLCALALITAYSTLSLLVLAALIVALAVAALVVAP